MKTLKKTILSFVLVLTMLATILPTEICQAGIKLSDNCMTAPSIEPGKEYTFDADGYYSADINLPAPGTSYYCKVEIPSDGNYTYKFKSAGEGIDIFLCDSNYKDIYGRNGLEHRSWVGTNKLTAGTYYIRFYTGAKDGDIHGTVSVSKEKSPAANIEYNTSEKVYNDEAINLPGATDLLQAPCLLLGNEYTFGVNDDSFNLNISEKGKSYYYKILVPKDGTYYYEFKSAATDGIDIWLHDENYATVTGVGRNDLAQESAVGAVQLKKGVYYIRFYTVTSGDNICGSVQLRNTAIKMKKPSGIKKGMKLTWNKFSGASGYEIRYARKANMLNAVTVDTNSSKASKTIKKLSAKKTYYVQVRMYVKDPYGNKTTGAWSSKVKVKTK